jgi:hypothetical protein
MSTKFKKRHPLPGEVTFAALPGPTRKRTTSPYCYRLVHRGEGESAGCALQWEVFGGREVYQIALERLTSGRLRWHCTCADAIFRGENRPHTCKHVRGLQSLGRGSSDLTVAPR